MASLKRFVPSNRFGRPCGRFFRVAAVDCFVPNQAQTLPVIVQVSSLSFFRTSVATSRQCWQRLPIQPSRPSWPMPHTEWRAAVDSWACCGHVLHTFLQIGSVPVRRRRNDDDDDDDDPPPADPSVAFAVFSSCVGTKCRARARMTPRPLILEIMGGK